jgi:hypothetical protein
VADSVVDGAQAMSDKQAADLAAAVYSAPAESVPMGEGAVAEIPASEATAEAGAEDISMEDVLGGRTRKQPDAAKERMREDVPEVETQTY